MNKVYFDNAATTRVTEEVLQAALPYLTENYGNPSSTHNMGTVAKNAIVEARLKCAKAINAEPEQIFFTSGATESNNIVTREFCTLKSPYEHPSMDGTTWGILPIDINVTHRAGIRTGLVAQMYVNNEIGTIFDVKECAELAHENGYKCLVDATQAFSHISIDVKDINCDFLSLSGHKFHAPKGVGLLYIKDPDGFIDNAESLVIGGGQERGLRSGTENVFGIVALGTAMELYNYKPEIEQHYKDLKRIFIQGLAKKCPVEIHLNQIEGMQHVNNIVNLSFRNINGESLAILLDYNGFCVSTGSACHSASLKESTVIKALKLPDEYRLGSIRISFSEENTVEEVKRLVEATVKNIIALMAINK